MPDDKVITPEQARERAEARLAAMPFPGDLVIIRVEEFELGWVFFYDSLEHQKSGLFTDAIGGNAPLIVDRRDGKVHVTGTAQPTSHYVDEYLRSAT